MVEWMKFLFFIIKSSYFSRDNCFFSFMGKGGYRGYRVKNNQLGERGTRGPLGNFYAMRLNLRFGCLILPARTLQMYDCEKPDFSAASAVSR